MKKSNYLIVIAIGAALFYNAWILAFWLNPKVVKTSLLSGLSALNQPYHQFFTLTDVLSACFTLVLAWGLFRQNKREDKHLHRIFLSIAGFGGTTGLATLFPYTDIAHSEKIPNPFKAPELFFHDLLSILSILFILTGVIFSFLVYRNKFVLFLVIAAAITTLLSFIAGAIPQLVGPLGQQINGILGGVWLVFICWRILSDTPKRGVEEN